MSILIKGIPLGGYEISIMKDGERYRARVDGIWCEVEEIPTTDTDFDTISRAKAIAEVEKARAYVGHRYNIESMVGRDIFEILDSVGLGISELPPAQPEQPDPYVGHWVNGRCDKCNAHAPFWAMASTYYESNFCPNCGADMREVTT